MEGLGGRRGDRLQLEAAQGMGRLIRGIKIDEELTTFGGRRVEG